MFEQFICKMAAWCAMICVVLFVKTVFCDDTLSSHPREELMNIRATVPKDLCPIFIDTSVNFLDILVKGALTFVYAVKRRRRGKRAGVLERLCGHRTPLPEIFISNVCSLCNKMEELQLLVGKTETFLRPQSCASLKRGCGG